MAIIFFSVGEMGQDGETPRRNKLVVSDNYATLTTAGYLNNTNTSGKQIYPTDIFDVLYNYTPTSGFQSASAFGTGTYAQFYPSFGAGNVVTLVATNAAQVGPETITAAVTSATPGTVRALMGKITESATTMTSGNIVGVRGEADLVGASGGFVYGVQGKVIPTGTLSGSVWAPAVFGQYDLSGATINAGQIAAIWGDMGASGGTFTDVTGARMFAGTNTIASLTLNSMIYLYGKATNLFELSGSSSTYIADGGSGSIGGTIKKIAFTIDGVTYYLVAGTTIT